MEEIKMIKTKNIKSGKWRTVESFWNAKGTAFFRAPEGGKIKIRYGYSIFGWNSQSKVLDGKNYKKLHVGIGSIIYARMQVKVSVTCNVTYDVYGGGVAINSPQIPF